MNDQNQNTVDYIANTSLPILKRYNVTKAGIFGSYAKNNFNENSDIDFLVEIPRGTGLIKFASLKIELENALKKEIDLVSYNSIKPQIKDEILATEKRII